MSSDVPLVGFSVAKSSRLDEDVELREAARDNGGFRWPMDPLEEQAFNEWAGEPGNRYFEIDEGSSTIEEGVSAPTVGGSDDPTGWLGVSNGEASEYRESVKTGVDMQCTKK
jgi:hypothetical protein